MTGKGTLRRQGQYKAKTVLHWPRAQEYSRHMQHVTHTKHVYTCMGNSLLTAGKDHTSYVHMPGCSWQ